MPDCKTCGSYFHACSSCGFSNDWEWEFCSESCRDTKMKDVMRDLCATYNISAEAMDAIVEKFRDYSLI